MAAASGEGTAGTQLLPAGTALALLGGLVYLGTLCAACKRYVLPTAPPLPLLGLGIPWWCLVAAHGDSVCSHPDLGLRGSAALLTPNPHLCPQCSST